ncbi:hypothetical protein TRVL_05379 [Trypanosoma vivax]|nr:hypothetical protein TRVL_05379 [Trypanosoma vivax]
MFVEFLGSADSQRLFELISEGNDKFMMMEKTFTDTFLIDSFLKVSMTLQRVLHGMITSPEGIGLVSSFFILDVMRKMNCEAAKFVFYDALLELERALRHDVCVAEQIKYASKDAKEGKKVYEATNSERYRIRSAAKSFAFRLLAGKVEPNETPLQAISNKQEHIDAVLDAWESNSTLLKEYIGDVAQSWALETERNTCEILSKNAAVLDSEARSALIIQTTAPHLPSLSLSPGELQLLLPGLLLTDPLLINSEPPTEDWKTAKEIIGLGCEGLLNREDHDKLIQSLSSSELFARLGVNVGLLVRIAKYNPDVAAELILRLSPQEGNQCIQQMLKSSLPEENMDAVLLHSSKILQHASVHAYITSRIQSFKDKSALSPNDKDVVKGFIMTLHQLLTKSSKENKEIYITEVLKADVTRLCERCDLQEVSTIWEELK